MPVLRTYGEEPVEPEEVRLLLLSVVGSVPVE